MKYKVEVSRSAFANATFIVEADSELDAQMKGLDKAHNHEFSEHSATYEVEYVEEYE